MQGVVDQDKGRTPQGSVGSPQNSAQGATSAGGAPGAPALPAQSNATGPAPAPNAPPSQPVSPSPTASKENEELQAQGLGKAEAFGQQAGAEAGYRVHDRALESPDAHAVALKACASETAAREPMLSPTRVLLKG